MAASHPTTVQLTPSYLADRLAGELAEVTGHRWHHQRTRLAGGGLSSASLIDWRVLPLRNPGGDPDRTDPGGPGPADFAFTPWLEHLPYLRGILGAIPAPLHAVRLMALGPGAVSAPHRDPKYALNRGFVRLHIPITTQPGAVLVIDGEDHRWQPGELWYGDFSREHLVRNTGDTTRIHAVIDALLTRELVTLFPARCHVMLLADDVLLNRRTFSGSIHRQTSSTQLDLPSGFTDFDHDDALGGPVQPAQLDAGPERATLAVAGRRFALVEVAAQEYRFAGWSEQRTIQLTVAGPLLHSRLGRDHQQRRLTAADCR
ncbi:aspartyl/asparaginyl beta-hydroxylase domain-containing protein [Actinoplanes sp. ATCC 53533]|uniref:aspartyl/asparaginyl beta-hydroxylase domain-containing protein n=1 Tax=Actinoplanes sp. ATCC 53533 TaxID=1288362 RepID=UPI00131506D0|nr:aspartyl/asparaginyl beta-hydroxylase domain-containing protein [Actinoplanes sp. ATCC 53533]